MKQNTLKSLKCAFRFSNSTLNQYRFGANTQRIKRLVTMNGGYPKRTILYGKPARHANCEMHYAFCKMLLAYYEMLLTQQFA